MRVSPTSFALIAAGLLAAATMTATAQSRRDSRPNIVVVLVDDLRWDALGHAGHPFARTPNIDRLAAEGVRFQNAFVTLPLCSPSRASFLTGQYAYTHGILDNTDRTPRSQQLTTFPALLQRRGYETAFVGKWHMGNDDAPRPGFDHWVSFKGQGVYRDPELNVNGRVDRATGYITDVLTEHALEFIRRRHTRPFCLYLSHKAVHGPFTPAERHARLFEGEAIQRRTGASDDLSGKPALRRSQPAAGSPAGRGPGDDLIRNQLRCLASIDEGLGRLLRALSGADELDNTLVVFTSDNGFFWGEHGLGDKRAAYEEALRIPLLIRYPRLVKSGSVRRQLVLNVDLAPTILDIARVPRPADLHGRSLVKVLGSERAGHRDAALVHYFNEPRFPRIPTWRAVRTERWKYIDYPDHPDWAEMYDLSVDPAELRNLAGDPSVARERVELQKELRRLLKSAGAPPERKD